MILEPTPENMVLVNRRQRAFRPLSRAALWPLSGVDVRGVENIPEQGPLMVVANHTSMLDTLFVGIGVGRPVIWVGSRTLLEGPVGAVVGRLGMIPKTRFARDTSTVRSMQRWLKLGAVVAVFPEGERTWDGHLRPLLPGVERLVRMMGVPIIAAQLHNGYLSWPRWAPRPRRGRVRVQFTEAKQAVSRSEEASLGAWIRDSLDVDPYSAPELRLRGRRLAAGISNVVFLCPACGADEQMRERKHTLRCARCATQWTVDSRAQLCRKGHAPLRLDHWLTETRSRVLADVSGKTEWLRSAPMTLEEHGEGVLPVASGELVLYADRLAVESGGHTRWTLPIEDVVDCNIEYTRLLEFRTKDRSFKTRLETGSVWRWPWMLQAAQRG